MKSIIKRLILQIKFKKAHVIINSANIGVNSSFGGYNKIGKKTVFDGQIGYASYIGSECVIGGKIGAFCSIGDYVRVAIGRHPVREYVSTSPSFYSNTRMQNGLTYVKNTSFEEIKYADEYNYIVVGNDVWIGQNATILSGVKIGDGAVVAAGAVVTNDVKPYEIVGGVPAKHIRYRFNENEIDYLLKLQWWSKGDEWIKSHSSLFENLSLLMEEVPIDE